MPDGSIDLVITGRIATLASAQGYGWVESIAIHEGRVVAVGSRSDLCLFETRATTVWRLPQDLVVVPSLTDAHLHLETAAMAAKQPDLTGCSRASAVATIAEAHRTLLAEGDSDGWLLGHGWSFDALSGRPRAAWLDEAAPGRPVALWAHDHHSRWLSSAALDQASLERREDPPAGRIERSPSGAPTGILYEAAAGLVDACIPGPSSDVVEAAIRDYARRLAGLGITAVHDPGGVAPDPALRCGAVHYRAMVEADRLPLRVVGSVREDQLERAIEIGFRSGRVFGPPGSGRYRDGWLKLFSDGALGSRTAALLSAYEDAGERGSHPGGSHGMPLRSRAQLIDVGQRAAAAGIAVEIHAIGDAAVRTALEAIERLPVVEGAAHRIEHAQLVDPADIDRFERTGIAASVQPSHLISDASAMRRAWGARTASAFPLGALSASGALMPLGSDAPVESPDPWPGIAAAVYRRGPGTDPAEVFHPDQAISLERALRAACLDAPRSAHIGDQGHLGPGARADLLVLPSLFLEEPGDPDVLGRLRPLATLLDGEFVHRAAQFDPGTGDEQ